MSKVRLFEYGDLSFLLAMAEQYCQSKEMELNVPSMSEYIIRVATEGVVYVYETEGGSIVGAVGLLLSKNPFTGEPALLQTDLFVSAGHRNTGVAKALRTQANQYADQLGIKCKSWELKRR